jgi:hypothetical protein
MKSARYAITFPLMCAISLAVIDGAGYRAL